MQRSAIIPYEGTKPYIFVSYAHKDSDRVMRILEKLDDRGYRIWYDDGIAPGSEWPENIAQHLNDCYLTLAFISPNSIASDNCRREITFALSKKKAFLAVLLEESEMPLGMEMQLSAQQCVMRHGYRSEEKFIDKICACPDLIPCQELAEEPVAEQKETVPEIREETEKPVFSLPKKGKPAKREKPAKKEKRGNNKKWAMAGGIAAALILLAVLLSSVTHVRITEDKKVSLNENYLSVGYETVTKETVRKINRLKKLTDLSFRNCEFEDGALECLRLPEGLKSFTVSECTGVDDLSCLKDLKEISTLYLVSCGLSDELMPTVAMPKLRVLDLNCNPAFSDLGKFAECSAITDLVLSGTGIQNLNGLAFPTLRKLEFSGTAVSDVSCLTACEDLAIIRGPDTKVTSLDALANLTELKTLEFNNCAIAHVSTPFAALRLNQLYLENTGVTDVSAFGNCTLLQDVHLAGNRISDVSLLEKSADTLKTLTLSHNTLETKDLNFLVKCRSLTELMLDGLALEDLDFAAGLYELTRLSAVGCGIADISGIQNCSNLKWLRLANNQITDISALRNLSALKSLDLAYNPVESLSSLPENNFYVLTLLGVPAKLGSMSAVEGTGLLADYSADLIGLGTRFARYYVMDCPADKRVALEDALGSYRLRFASLPEEVAEYMAEYDLDYSFLAELQ